jgi:hypothetical protein
MAGGNKQYFHISAATAGTTISPYSGAILGIVNINTASTGASGGILTIYDDTAVVAAHVVAVITTIASASNPIPSLEYEVTMSRGIFVTFTAGATTTGDLTITYL